MNEEFLFDSYRSRPSTEALIRVLRASQDRVYTLCQRVLRQREDAEDASQKVFLKLLDLVPGLNDGQHYRRMLSRVALQTALDDLRARRTRQEVEGRRAGMNPGSCRSEGPGEDLKPLQEHLARLGEDDRILVVDYYFEGKPLEEIAENRGCSKVAVWKKLERVRAQLRQSLSGAGATAVALGLPSTLEALVLTPAPGDLVTPVVIEKAALVAGIGSTPTGLALGGLLMAGKGSSAAIAAAVLVVALLAGGALIATRTREIPVASLVARKGTVRAPGGERRSELLTAPLGTTSAEGGGGPSQKDREPLLSRLERFREVVRFATKAPEGETEPHLRISKEGEGIRSDVLAHPEVYLAFLRAPGNEDIFGELLNVAFARYRYRVGEGKLYIAYGEEGPNQDKVPQAILEGLLDLLDRATTDQKVAIVQVLPASDENGKGNTPLLDRCVRLLGESDPMLSTAALRSIQNGDPERLRKHMDLLSGMLENLRTVKDESIVYSCKLQCLQAIASQDTAASDEILMRVLKEACLSRDFMTTELLSNALPRCPSPDDPAPMASLLQGALGAAPDTRALKGILDLALTLPLRNATPILEEALALAASAEIRENLQATLVKIREGERGKWILQQTLNGEEGGEGRTTVVLPK